MNEIEQKELPLENIDFNYVELDDPSILKDSKNPVVVLRGKYEGVLVQYGKISIAIEEVPPRVVFDFNILRSGSFDKDVLSKNANFKDLLGDIIMSTILELAKATEQEGVENNEGRNNDSESSS